MKKNILTLTLAFLSGWVGVCAAIGVPYGYYDPYLVDHQVAIVSEPRGDYFPITPIYRGYKCFRREYRMNRYVLADSYFNHASEVSRTEDSFCYLRDRSGNRIGPLRRIQDDPDD